MKKKEFYPRIILLLLVSFLFACNVNKKGDTIKEIDRLDSVHILQQEANELLKKSSFVEAEKLFKTAISINSNSSLFVDLFRLYAIQGEDVKAEEALREALSFENVDSMAYYLKAKFLFARYKRDSIDQVLHNFKMSYELGYEEGRDYYEIISLMESYRIGFLDLDAKKLIEMNFQEALIDYYGSITACENGIEQSFKDLKGPMKMVDWNYFIPDKVFSTANNAKIAKVRTMLFVQERGIDYHSPDTFIVLSVNGVDWYTMSYMKTHKKFLSQYFSDEILDQLFK